MAIALRHIRAEVDGAVGPRGGNLNNPKHQPECRRASFNPLTKGGLHRFEDTATVGHKNELPWHRMAAYMLINRRTNSEIAMAADVDLATISQLRANRWFQELLATIANEQGEEVTGIIAGHAIDAVNTIAEVMNDPDSTRRERITAAQILLEQAQGKPVQKNINLNENRRSSDPIEEYAGIVEELKTLRAQVEPAKVLALSSRLDNQLTNQ